MTIEFLLTSRLVLGRLKREDAAALRTYEFANRERFAPHGPLRSDEDFLPAAFAARVDTMVLDQERGASSRWVLRLREAPTEIIGHVAITVIQRGVRHAGFLGYGIAGRHVGQGLACEAVAVVLGHAFDALNLHRIEATHNPDNAASARLLAKLGFEREGLAREYIQLNGAWQDQVLNGLCNRRWAPQAASQES